MKKAIELFSLQGYDQTSIQEIADKCDISQTTILYHFKSKKILFQEILKYIIASNRSVFSRNDHSMESPFEKLKSLLMANIQWAYEFPEQTKVLISLFHFACSDSEMSELATQSIDNGRKLTLEVLSEFQDNDLKLNREAIAVTLQQYINGVLFQMIVRTDKENTYLKFKSGLDILLKKFLF